MSLSSTATLKNQLTSELGADQSEIYFTTLRNFITGSISRMEFEEVVKTVLSKPSLVQLHNTLVISFFDPRSHKRPITPPRELSKPLPPRKRRRILPYQGPDTPDSDLTLHSSRLKRWTLSLGRKERDRIKEWQQATASGELPPTLSQSEEIAGERGVTLVPERGDPPGSRLPVHLLSVSNALSLQHISDKLNLVAAQNNLANPQRNVANLMQLAVEIKLKQLISRAIALTASSDVVTSISPPSSSSSDSNRGRRRPVVLDTAAFSSLFSLYPSSLPNGSSSARRLQLMGDIDHSEDDPDSDIALLRDREVDDPRWQIVALLGQRSTVKEALRGLK